MSLYKKHITNVNLELEKLETRLYLLESLVLHLKYRIADLEFESIKEKDENEEV